MYNLHLTAEQLEFRDTVRGFVNDEVKPVTLKADRLDLADRSLPLDVLRKASQMGLRTLALPEDLGGVGADALTCCIVTEELAVGDTDVAAVLTRDVGAGAAAVRGDDAGAARPLPARRSWRTTTITSPAPSASRTSDSALGVNYHRPVTGERQRRDDRDAQRQRVDHQRRSRTASPTRRSPS